MPDTKPIVIPVEVDEESVNKLQDSLGAAFKSIGIVVGAAIAAFKALEFALKGTEEGALDLKTTLAGLSGVMDQIQTDIGNIVLELRAFALANKGLIDFTIQLIAIIPGINLLAKGLLIVAGNYREVFLDAKQAALNQEIFRRSLANTNLAIATNRNLIAERLRLFREDQDNVIRNVVLLQEALDFQNENIRLIKEQQFQERELQRERIRTAPINSEIRRQETEAFTQLVASQQSALESQENFTRRIQNFVNQNTRAINAQTKAGRDAAEISITTTIPNLIQERLATEDLTNARMKDIQVIEQRTQSTITSIAQITNAFTGAFADNKGFQIAQIIVNTAAGIAAALAPPIGPNPFLAAAIATSGGIGLATIINTEIGSGGGVGGGGFGGEEFNLAGGAGIAPLSPIEALNIAQGLAPPERFAFEPSTVLVIEDLDTVRRKIRFQESVSTLGG